MPKKKKKILFVAMSESIHTARWIENINDQGWDIHLYPSIQNKLHENINNVTFHPQTVLKIITFLKKINASFSEQEKTIEAIHTHTSPLAGQIKKIFIRFYTSLNFTISLNRAKVVIYRLKEILKDKIQLYANIISARNLNNLIIKLKPDLIHSLEFQHAGYLVLDAKRKFPNPKEFPKWMATNWGSDIYFFSRFSKHKNKIQSLLQNIDYYSCETERDLCMAKDLGLRATAWPILPNTGGFQLAQYKNMRQTVPTSKRKIIMVKGYESFAGRALRALHALEMIKASLNGYEILVYNVTHPGVETKILQMQKNGVFIKKLSYQSHEQMMALHAQSRVHLAVSISDGISTAMLEAMVMGSFPIQTDTSGASEWLEEGVTGFIVPPHNIEYIAECVSKALSNDKLVDNAASLNWKVAKKRLEKTLINKEIVKQYTRILYHDK